MCSHDLITLYYHSQTLPLVQELRGRLLPTSNYLTSRYISVGEYKARYVVIDSGTREWVGIRADGKGGLAYTSVPAFNHSRVILMCNGFDRPIYSALTSPQL